ncbi:ATP-grasp domain-containing protein [Patescibacteria group bacterium]|nr:ATP-grasp domain-containing protein [Patescibacteria group bacterium]
MKQKNVRPAKVTVLYNEITSLSCGDKDAILSEEGGREDARAIAKALSSDGYKPEIFELTPENISDLNKIKTDLFFNLCDGIGNLPKTEHKVPEILDQMSLPYTGANASSLILTTNKVLTKKIFEQNNIPTPAYAVFETVPDELPSKLEFPLFAKPVAEDCSLGINNESVIKNLSQLRRAVKRLLKKYNQPVLVEEYIAGREFNVTIMGNGAQARVLPISEIVFGKFYVGKPKFVDFKAKWLESSLYFRNTVGVCPAKIDAALKRKIEKLALKAYFACGGRDYARVDIRLSRDEVPYFLEVNLNCDISPQMGASRSAKASGLSYSQFIGKLAHIAAQRYAS